MQVLVTGGAGYIGSHTAKALARAGYEPIVLDNFCRGHRWAVRWGPLLELDLADRAALDKVFREHRIGAVIHFAAFIAVGESMTAPAVYFRNNLVNTINLLEAMREHSVNRFVFSSTAAVYGDPQRVPLTEDHPQNPVNPYGETKLMVERTLAWFGRAYGLSWTALRYFNAAGADPGGEIGELHDPETHLIPLAIGAANGDIPELHMFGTDYDTPDGTAIRDYIHVNDLADAHLRALERLSRGGASGPFNLGTGHGYSVKQVLSAIERIGGRRVPVKTSPRRAGDAPILVADSSLAAKELGWTPAASLDHIVETAWNWYTTSRANSLLSTR
jgi:UDP-arabinose 4-epimerase